MNATQNATHTPGPWEVDSTERKHEINSTGNQWAAVAVVAANWLGVHNVGDDEAKANAHLVSAAPDLLAACKAALALLDSFNGTFAESQQLAAAIAKAEGTA